MSNFSSIGCTYYDSTNDPAVVVTVQQSGERFAADVLPEHEAELEDLLLSNPLGSNPDLPPGIIPAETSVLKVSSWKATDGLWHWVETPVGSLDPMEWAVLHAQRVAAAQGKYPPV